MRELFKKSGHVDDWANMFNTHSQLLKGKILIYLYLPKISDHALLDLINELCAIDENDFDYVWATIESSMRQFPRDIISNAKKKIQNREASNGTSITSTSTPVIQSQTGITSPEVSENRMASFQ